MRALAAGCLSLDEDVLPGVSVESLLRHESGLPPFLPLHAVTPAKPRRHHRWGPRRAATAGEAARDLQRSRLHLAGRAVGAAPGSAARRGRFMAWPTRWVWRSLFVRSIATKQPSVSLPRAAPRPAARARPASACRGIVHDDNARAMLGVSGHAGLFGTLAGVADLSSALLDAYHGCDTPQAQSLSIPTTLVRAFCAPRSARWTCAGHDLGPGLGSSSPLPSDGAPPTSPLLPARCGRAMALGTWASPAARYGWIRARHASRR